MRTLGTRTTLTVALGAIGVIAALVLTRATIMGPDAARMLGSYFLVGFPLFTTVWCWWCAAEMPVPSMRWPWVFFGAAAVLFGLGQFLEEFVGQASADSVSFAEILYMVAIVTFGIGTWLGLRTFVGFLDVGRSTRVSSIVTAGATLVVAAAILLSFGRIEGSMAQRIMLVAYPIGLLWLMAMPALALALVVSQMGSGVLAQPWWLVFVGVTLLTCANVILVVVTALGTTLTNGGPMEMAWWVGLSLISIGAALQMHVQKPVATRQS